MSRYLRILAWFFLANILERVADKLVTCETSLDEAVFG